MDINLFTIATHEDGYFKLLLDSCKRYNIKIDVIGYGEKYTGHIFKIKKTIEYLRSKKSNSIILFVDAFDSIIIDNINNIKSKFINMNIPYLFSEDLKLSYKKYLLFWILHKLKLDKNQFFYNTRPCIQNNKMFIINSGMFIGYCSKLLELFNLAESYINKTNKDSNQRVLQDMCNDNIEFHTDVNKVIFYNTRLNELKKLKTKNSKIMVNNYSSSIISAPGNNNLSHLIKYLNYDISKIIKRKKYYEFYPNKIKRKFKHYFYIVIFLIIIYLIYII